MSGQAGHAPDDNRQGLQERHHGHHLGGKAWSQTYPDNTIGVRDANEIDIVPVEVASDDTFEVTVTVALPPFCERRPTIYINAIDGEEPKANTLAEKDMKDQSAQVRGG